MAKTQNSADAGAEAPKKSKMKLIVFGLLGLVLVGGGGAAGAYVFLKPSMEAEHVEPPKTYDYYQMEEAFTSNIAGSPRLVQVKVGIGSDKGPLFFDEVKKHETPIRAAMLAQLAEAPLTDLTNAEGRTALAEEMREATNAQLKNRGAEPGVTEVFFTDLVIQ